MNHYVYKITDPVTSEFYIGVRSCSCPIHKDDYMGSMCTWKPDKPERLKKEVLGIFDTREEANEYERREIERNFEHIANRNYIVPAHGMGNFRRQGEPLKNDILNIRINSDLKADIYKCAQSEGLSITDFVIRVLTIYVRENK